MTTRGLVMFGDVVRSRDDLSGATAWLRTLTSELEDAYAPEERLAAVAFTQGDEVQVLLSVEADPFEGVLRAALHPEGMKMRWAIAAGTIEPGRGPATERTGEAFLVARSLLERARSHRESLVAAIGSEPADRVLGELAPLLGDLLEDLTDRQREVARLLLVEGLRQSDAAEQLHVSRATISVMAERARIRRLQGLLDVLRGIVREAATGMVPA